MTDAPTEILLVEDDPAVGYMVAALLGTSGHQVMVADTFCRARKMIDRGPDAAILDLMIPGGSGEVLISILRDERPGCRVIVYTGAQLSGERAAILRAKGAAEVLQKPVAFRTLLKAIRGEPITEAERRGA